jgi:clan AA aspartic protease (TIGR02281 family)
MPSLTSPPARRRTSPRTSRLALAVLITLTSACMSPPRTTADEPRPPRSPWVYGAESTTRGDASRWLASPTAREAHLTGDGSQLLVEARLNGRVSGTFLVDTGASYCVITPATARRLGLQHGNGDGAVTLATPTGDIEAPITTLRVVEVANARAGDVSTVIYPAVDEPLAGILGLSFLNQFEFSVDSRRRVLRLKPF